MTTLQPTLSVYHIGCWMGWSWYGRGKKGVGLFVKRPYCVDCMAGQTRAMGKGKEELTSGVSVLPVNVFLLNDLSRHTPPILSATFFGWIPQLLRIPEGEMLDIVGLDAVMVCFFKKYLWDNWEGRNIINRKDRAAAYTRDFQRLSPPASPTTLNCFAYRISCFAVFLPPTQCEHPPCQVRSY